MNDCYCTVYDMEDMKRAPLPGDMLLARNEMVKWETMWERGVSDFKCEKNDLFVVVSTLVVQSRLRLLLVNENGIQVYSTHIHNIDLNWINLSLENS